jgi:gamma-carbonic anhydrase
MMRAFEGKTPCLGAHVFIAESAVVIGDVTIGQGSSIWYGTVIRGDVNSITIGDRTNIQDQCLVHVTTDMYPAWIGDQVTIGHGAIVHGCKIGSRSLVGIGAIVLDGAEVGEGCVIAAGSLLPPRRRYPANSLVMGSPAQVKRHVTAEEREMIQRLSESYTDLAARHASLPP